jgi:hypothetical protein
LQHGFTLVLVIISTGCAQIVAWLGRCWWGFSLENGIGWILLLGLWFACIATLLGLERHGK